MFKHIAVIMIAIALVITGCKKTTITPKLFVTIQNEILDSDMQQTTKEDIVKKYGITLQQYEEYEKQVESDPELKALVGKERLNIMKK
ncbi:MAG: hypothetical protein GYA16_08840 [Spirochaetes bacterium]|nr:hypothetical protein [Spirochaetota bacterium]NMB64957.1 hypothetical protein [Spirochaetota bacterium]HOJ28160.1 hypothetical protein [Spirochaetota bacterium]HOM09239.1 hypothetical protein [Spirochaetota bacterium]HPP49039.1 hypothetical protein [Spirochaetota bacterium]